MSGLPRPGWLRRWHAAGATPDGELVRRFHDHADQDAFELLVHRHAPMVLRVCRAVVRDPHLAEDAAQAVFLVLARRAGTVAGVQSVSAWLARVAYRAAGRARARAGAHPASPLDEGLPAGQGPDPADVAAASDVAAVVLEEVHRLPERYQAPVVLCYLDGLTYTEAAARLGWPAGTVAGRLARARRVLRDRLARRGVAVPAAGVAAVLGPPAASAVSTRFADGVLGAVLGTSAPSPTVATLTREVLNAMTPSLSRVATRVAVALGLVAAAVAVPLAAGDKPAPESPPPADKPADKPADPDLAFDEALAKEGKLVVVGTVLDADARTPMEGVEVTASAGMGTLFRTGATKTDKDGRFRLVFRPGIAVAGRKVAGVAVVHARKPGWYGWSYGWPAQFVLTDEPLSAAELKEYPKYTNLTPGHPSRLVFRMRRAAAVKVTLVDGAGRPLPDTRVWLTGRDLPPGASVLADRRTDAAGSVAVADVPRSSYRLVLVEGHDGGRGELEVGSIQFRDAAEYEAVATIHEWGPRATHVSFKVTRGPDR